MKEKTSNRIELTGAGKSVMVKLLIFKGFRKSLFIFFNSSIIKAEETISQSGDWFGPRKRSQRLTRRLII